MKLRKFICFIISIAMSFAGTNVIFGGFYSETDVSYETDGYTIYFDESTGTITAVYGGDADLTIPSEINGVTVTTIGSQAFGGYYETLMGKITIPDTVTTIETGAFSHLTSGEIILPDSVETIGNRAFFDWHCTETNPTITIPSSVISIGLGVFSPDFSLSIDYDCGCAAIEVNSENNYYSSLDGVLFNKDQSELITYPFAKSADSYEVPDSVTSIDDSAFAYSKLKSVTIPKSVTAIGDSPFYYCTELETVYCYEGSTADDSSLYPDGVTIVYIEEEADYELIFDSATGTVTGYTGTPTNVTIPSEIDGVAVTAIGDKAFAECSYLESIVISSGVASIGYEAFNGCTGLEEVQFSDETIGISIGKGAFMYCTKLENVIIPGNITSFGGSMFYCCTSLKKVTILNGVTSIGALAFYGCTSLTDITIPNSVTTIGSCAFDGCISLTDITIPNSVTIIGTWAFYGCTSLTNITIPNGVSTIGRLTFYGCTSLTDITIPNSVTTIGDEAFGACTSLTSIIIPSGITSIESSAFYSCSGLTSVTVESTIAEVGENAFSNCTNLKYVYCYEGSVADDSSLYPDGVTIVYLDESGDVTTESTTETTTETTTITTSTETTTGCITEVESSTEETSSETTTEGEFVSPPAFGVAGVFGGRTVTFTSETDGAVIYYSSATSTLTTDDISVSNGETVLFEDFYGTLYARAYYNGSWSNVSRLILKIPVVNTPTVTASGSTVTVKSTTPSSFICYTTDGSEPVVETDGTVTNGTWLKVNGARTNSGTVTAEPGDTVRAVAVRSCFTTSASAAAYVNVSPAAFTVVGTFGGRNVTFKSDTSGAKIYYSSTTSSLTTSDKCVSNGETVLFENFYGTIYARAYYNGKWSNVSRLILKIPTINTPTITYSGGKATIRTTTPSCYIYYTTNGTTPSITNGKKLCSNSYGQVTVSSGTTIKAIAVRSCFTNSEVVEYEVN